MIRITVELHSAVTGKRTVIGDATIANVGGTPARGEYSVCFVGKTARSIRYSRIANFPRKSCDVWELLRRALNARIKPGAGPPADSTGYFHFVIPDRVAPRFCVSRGQVLPMRRGRMSKRPNPKWHAPVSPTHSSTSQQSLHGEPNIESSPTRSSVASALNKPRKFGHTSR